MNDEIRREIRQILNEEIRSPQRPLQSSAMAMVSRTRSLIGQASQSSASTSEVNSNSMRPGPFHQQRLSGKRKRKSTTEEIKTYEMQIVKYSSSKEVTINDDIFVLKQVMVNLNTNMLEEDVRLAILDAVKVRFPKLKSYEIEFMKRERSKLNSPLVSDNFKWNYPQVKTLIGQGKLYVRLLVNPNTDSSSDDDLPPVLLNTKINGQGSSTSTSSFSRLTLREMFPDASTDIIDTVANTCTDINDAIDMIEEKTKEISTSSASVVNITRNDCKKRLVVDEDSVFEDCLSYYKHKDFDPRIPLKVVFSGQSAIDAGGPLRQFYTLAIQEISRRLFEGNSAKLVPKVDANTCLTEIYTVIGKMIAHNIAQGCQGFPVLADACFSYLCSGSIQQAAVFVKIEQVANGVYQHFIKEVCDIF